MATDIRSAEWLDAPVILRPKSPESLKVWWIDEMVSRKGYLLSALLDRLCIPLPGPPEEKPLASPII